MSRPTPLLSARPEPPSESSAQICAEPTSRRFYIPTSSAYVSPTFPPAGAGSRSRSSLTIEDALYRYPSAGSSRTGASPRLRPRGQGRGRGQSLVALTTALQAYRVPPPADDSVDIGSAASLAGRLDYDASGGPSTDRLQAGPSVLPTTPPPRLLNQPSTLDPPFTPMGRGSPGSGWSRAQLELQAGQQVEMEIMDALVDIHRVLYCGREDQVGGPGQYEMGWDREVGELERVVGRWFEGDAIYDHPLLRLGSRYSLLNHFILLHLLGSGSIPALTPGNALTLARNAAQGIAGRIADALSSRPGSLGGRDEEAASAAWQQDEKSKGKSRAVGHAADEAEKPPLKMRDGSVEAGEVEKWKLWRVAAECTEIGGMECYDGYHLGLIEHVITLNLLPSLTQANPRLSDPLATLSSSSSTLSLLDPDDAALALIPSLNPSPPPRAFTTRLACAVGREFGYLLTWELPISTVVQFNEVGRVTHIRDTIDVQDLIEGFVPFAKRLSWLTRRITGLASSVIGGVVAGLAIPRLAKGKAGQEVVPVKASGYQNLKRQDVIHDLNYEMPSSDISRDEMSTTSDPDSDANFGMPLRRAGGLAALGLEEVARPPVVNNTLGLDGMLERVGASAGMAPDRDDGC